MTVPEPHILVCGPRAWTSPFYVRCALLLLRAEYGCITIIHGGARGVDSMAGEIAEELGFNVRVYRADWAQHGRGAGFKQNIEMLDTNPVLVVAIGWGSGTNHTMTNAAKRNMTTKWFFDWMFRAAA